MTNMVDVRKWRFRKEIAIASIVVGILAAIAAIVVLTLVANNYVENYLSTEANRIVEQRLDGTVAIQLEDTIITAVWYNKEMTTPIIKTNMVSYATCMDMKAANEASMAEVKPAVSWVVVNCKRITDLSSTR